MNSVHVYIYIYIVLDTKQKYWYILIVYFIDIEAYDEIKKMSYMIFLKLKYFIMLIPLYRCLYPTLYMYTLCWKM